MAGTFLRRWRGFHDFFAPRPSSAPTIAISAAVWEINGTTWTKTSPSALFSLRDDALRTGEARIALLMPTALTRREWLRLTAGASAGTLLSLGLWPGRLRGADAPPSDDFTFIAVNDLHALEPACRPWFDIVVRQMK